MVTKQVQMDSGQELKLLNKGTHILNFNRHENPNQKSLLMSYRQQITA